MIATRYLEILATDLNCPEASLELPHPALINYFKRLGYEKEVKKGSRVVRLKKHIGAQFVGVQNGGQS
ncbi:MAG TPA: hypothetical protein VFG03_12690 [Telluria sp.]|nr:hypothetical protein [Telluria sp.]